MNPNRREIDLSERIPDLEKQLEEIKRHNAELLQEIESLKAIHLDTLASAKLKIGAAVIEIVKNPLKIFLFPFRMVKICFEKKKYDSEKLCTITQEKAETPPPPPEKLPPLDEYRLRDTSLKKLKVAIICDEFTYESYKPECSLCYISPDKWEMQLTDFDPDMMLVESTWHGIDSKWHDKILIPSKEYYDICVYCKKRGIPIAFWNKEDPIRIHEFMNAAEQADFVFTTGIDVIPEYKRILDHNRVYHLHFAAQPKYHNPLEMFIRKDKFCFAGTYYHPYKERSAIFDEFAYFLIGNKGLDIYARNYRREIHADYAFPQRYDPFILGELEPNEIDKAYKGYFYNINMNSISTSESMFARRVFELMASNTIVVGNYARGIKNYFGDLTISTDSVEELQGKLAQYCSDDVNIKKYRLLGLRKVLKGHLYEDRLAYIVKKVFREDLLPPMPQITVFTNAATKEEKIYVTSCYERQSYPCKKLELDAKTSDCVGNYAGYVTIFDVNDYYAENYLMDLALSTRWTNCDGIGKSQFYNKTDDGIVLSGAFVYQTVSVLSPRRAIFKAKYLSEQKIEQFLKAKTLVSSNQFVSIDEFNYCANTKEPDELFTDIEVCNQGIDYETL